MLRTTCTICNGRGWIRLDAFTACECSMCNATGRMLDFALHGERPPRRRTPWLKNLLIPVIAAGIFWLGMTNLIYAMVHPDKTSTDLFLHILKSFLLEFDQ